MHAQVCVCRLRKRFKFTYVNNGKRCSQARAVHRQARLSARAGAARSAGQGRGLEGRDGRRGENHHARHHALELAAVPRFLPDRQLVSGHRRRHAVQRDRLQRVVLGTR